MKIALVSPYDVAQPGGVSDHITHLKTEFAELGHETVVMAPRARKGGLEVGDGFYGVGRPIAIPSNGSTARLTFDVTLYTAVKALMRRERFDVVHVHEPLVPVLPYMVLLNSAATNVATFHAFRSSSAWYTTLKPYLNLMLSRLDARIAVSAPAHEFVGRFPEPRKGFKYLVRAMPLVHQQFPTARLVVVGTGRPEKYAGLMERYAVANVDFLGHVPFGELPRYYASCDVFCAPSVARESFGIVLLEAMATGKPVVAGDNPGYASVLTHGREGLLARPKDEQALALALVRLLADAGLRRQLGAAGRVTASRYDWPLVARRVLDVYDRAASRAAAAPRQRGLA